MFLWVHFLLYNLGGRMEGLDGGYYAVGARLALADPKANNWVRHRRAFGGNCAGGLTIPAWKPRRCAMVRSVRINEIDEKDGDDANY